MFRINLINLQKPTCQFLKITAGTERVFARWTAGMQKYILQTPAYATTLLFVWAHLMGGKLRHRSGCKWQPRQGTATPPIPHADEMCFAAKLCSFKQEIMCTLFRISKKANEKLPGFVFLFFWPQRWLKGGLCCYQIWIKVNAEMKIPQRAQYWLLWTESSERAMCAVGTSAVQAARATRAWWEPQQRPHRSKPCTDPTPEPRNTLTASVTGTAEHGQDTHSQDRSVQVWTPSHYHLKWKDTSQRLSKWTQTHQHCNISNNVLTF